MTGVFSSDDQPMTDTLPLFPEDTSRSTPTMHALAVRSLLILARNAGPAACKYPPSIYAQVILKCEEAVAYLDDLEQRRARREADMKARAHRGEGR